MQANIKTTRGQYRPMEFILDLEFDISNYSSVDEIDVSDCATLFHEFIHYYQDIALGFSQNLFVERNKQIANLNNAATKIQTVSVPLQFMGTDKFREELKKLYFARRDSNFEWKTTSNIPLVKYRKVPTADLSTDNPAFNFAEKVFISLDGEQEFEFDGYVLLEGMASIYEKYVFPSERHNYQKSTPYSLPYLLAKEICNPEIHITELEIGLICEISLEFFHAGRQFVWILEKLINNGIKPIEVKNHISLFDSCDNLPHMSLLGYQYWMQGEYIYSLQNVCGNMHAFTDIKTRTQYAFIEKMKSRSGGLMFDKTKELIGLDDSKKKETIIGLVKAFSPIIRVFDENEPIMYKCMYLDGPFSLYGGTWFFWWALDETWKALASGKIEKCPFECECIAIDNDVKKCKDDPFNLCKRDCMLGAILMRLRIFGKAITKKSY